MANRVAASAPGKLMLFGEHAVVYGYPSIVTAVDQRVKVTLGFNGEDHIKVRAPQVGLSMYQKKLSLLGKQNVPKPVRFIELLVKNYKDEIGLKRGLDIVTESDFSVSFGFGSSAAVTVALAFALSKIHNHNLGKRKLFDLCYKTVLDVQGVGSGFDLAAAIYGGTLYFVKAGKKIKRISDTDYPLVVGYTGVKADTPSIVRQVAEFKRNNSEMVEKIFKDIEKIVKKALDMFEAGNIKSLGKLMDDNQRLLVRLGVSSEELDKLILASKDGGALGAKLSGAGGGDCMIAFQQTQDKNKIEKAIAKAGGEVLKVTHSAEGVRLE